MNTTTNHGAVIPLLPTLPKDHSFDSPNQAVEYCLRQPNPLYALANIAHREVGNDEIGFVKEMLAAFPDGPLPCTECGRELDDGPHDVCPSDDCPSHDTPITDAHMKTLPYSWDYFDYETEKLLKKMETELDQLRVRNAAYEYQMLRLANHQPHPLPDDKAAWPATMYGRYMDLLAEFNDFKNAMSSYIGDSRVHEAITHYEINNRYTN